MYTVDYFISKFEAIPENFWIIGTEGYYGKEKKCALGFCRIDENELRYEGLSLEGKSLVDVLSPLKRKGYGDSETVWATNDGLNPDYCQATPKQRILAALYDIKKMQQPVYENITKQLAILPVNETADTLARTPVTG